MDGSGGPTVHFGVLGPLTACRNGVGLDLGPLQQRVTLAVLLLHANTRVNRSQLIDDIWGTDVPTYAVNLLQKNVSALRRVLEPDRGLRTPSQLLTWTEAGYRLKVPAGLLDLQIFENALVKARAARTKGDHERAVKELQSALALWRGPAFEGLRSPLLDAERGRLEEKRIGVIEDRIELDLTIGSSADLIPELRAMVAENPLRERLHRLLMLALYRAGRQADALSTFRDARRQLHDQLGVEPGPELAQMHRRILAADPSLNLPSAEETGHARDLSAGAPADAGQVRPAQLPHAPADFIGRADALRQLDALLADHHQPGGTVVISAIAGTAGVGKTALAVHWAHKIRDRFPDGQLYVNLRGFDPGGPPMDPAQAIRGFIEALGAPSQRIPASLDGQIGLYRSLLGDRRVLILLDNVHDSDQARPLLPGSPGCLVIVTSRNDLTGLVAGEAARPIAIDLLSSAEARALLRRRLGGSRLEAEPRAVDQIIAACARLPLALTIAAARAATRPRFPLSVFAAELRRARSQLDAFDDGDRSTDVRGVFSWSYQSLSPMAARLFRLQALHLGPDISESALASLAGMPADDLRPALAELTRAHLVAEQMPGRFGFHDLLRAYAVELVLAHEQTEDREAAIRRLLDHYIQTADRARRLLSVLGPHQHEPVVVPAALPGVSVGQLVDHDDAVPWFAGELPDLLAALGQAFDGGFDDEAWHLASVLTPFLETQGVWYDEWSAELAASKQLDDLHRQALTQRLLGRACVRLNRHDQAQKHLRQALDLYGRVGDVVGQAVSHRDLAWGLDREARHQDALWHAERSLELFQLAGHATGQARALNAIGWFNGLMGDHEVALARCREALDVLQRIGDRFGEAETWDSLGYTYRQLGDWARARACYERALDLYREFGDRYNEADTMAYLGDALDAAGAAGEAQAAWEQALSILEDLGHPDADRVRAKLDSARASGVYQDPAGGPRFR